MDTQELENLQKSSSTKSQDAEEKTSEELERNLNLNEANNKVLREVELRRQRVAETSKLVGSMIGAFLGTMIYSKIYQEYEGETWTESLMNGLIAAVSLGFGFLLGKILQMKLFLQIWKTLLLNNPMCNKPYPYVYKMTNFITKKVLPHFQSTAYNRIIL